MEWERVERERERVRREKSPKERESVAADKRARASQLKSLYYVVFFLLFGGHYIKKNGLM